MTGTGEATEQLLEERPELEEAVETVLRVDEEHETWTFQDVPLDSGTFGELVSRGIVEKADDGAYRVENPAAVRAALAGESAAPETTTADRVRNAASRLRARYAMDYQVSLLFFLSFLFLFLMRIVTYRSIFRGDRVVFPGNDPYHYRYRVEQILANSDGPFDWSYVANLPPNYATREPLTYATGWWLSELFGGSVETAAVVLAWLPVVNALVVGALVYLFARLLTDDRRIAIVSVAMLALVPAHALYSALGFFDHHTFDYVWSTATALCLLWLARDVERRVVAGDPIEGHLRQPSTWLVAGILGVAVAAQMLNWNGAPLVLGGFAVYVAVRSVIDIRAGCRPYVSLLPIAGGLAVASLLTHTVHTVLGWQEPIAVYAPAMLLAGSIAVAASAELVRRSDSPPIVQGTIVAGVAIGAPVVLRLVRPAYFERFLARANDLFGREGITETRSLFSSDFGVLLGPVDQLGLLLYVSLPVFVAAVVYVYRGYRPTWAVLGSYGWYLFALTLVQIRFVGDLSPFVAVASGVGFVYLLSKIGLAAAPDFAATVDERAPVETFEIPTPVAGVYVMIAFLLVGSLGFAMVPIMQDSVAINDGQYEAAVYLDEEADDDSYVLSHWGRNRLYNYFATGEADSYAYADRHYEPFLASQAPDEEYYDRFNGTVDYVIIRNLHVEAIPETAYSRLHDRLGSRGNGVEGLSHFRVVFRSSDGEITVVSVVEGATITGTAEPNESVNLSANVSIPGAEFTYARQATADEEGTFAVTVPYPGEYRVGNESVTVTESDVERGATIESD